MSTMILWSLRGELKSSNRDLVVMVTSKNVQRELEIDSGTTLDEVIEAVVSKSRCLLW